MINTIESFLIKDKSLIFLSLEQFFLWLSCNSLIMSNVIFQGILSRGSHIAPPSAFYGGDVEVDQEDGPRNEQISDGYRTI